MIQQALQRVLDGHDLGRDETREVMGEIMAGEATPAQIGGFLVALRLKGETAEEIAGSAEAIVPITRQVPATTAPNRFRRCIGDSLSRQLVISRESLAADGK